MLDIAGLIARTVFRCQPSMTRDAARAVADTILGDIEAANLKIVPSAGAQPAVAAPKSAERRRTSRGSVLKSATIVFSQGHCSMDCQVLDVTETGARLRPADILLCPKEFTLKLHHGPVHDCEVKWRRGNSLGVRFL